MKRIVCALALLALAGCAGFQPVHSPADAAPSSRVHRLMPVLIKMAFPHRRDRRRSRTRRSPLYVSQYTQSVALAFAGGPTAFSQTFTVTPGSGACPTAGGTTTCSWSIALAPGTYRATIVATDAGHNVLSETNAPAVVNAGTGNTLNFTMYAVPTGVGIFANLNGLGNAGFFGNIYDLNAPLSFSIYLYGVTEGGRVQIITGVGSPQLTAKRISGTLDVGLTQPAGDPPTFTVSALAASSLGVATIGVTASFPDSDADICSLPNASCTSTPLTFSGQELVAVCCASGLQLFGIDGTGPLATIGSASSNFTAFAVDASNDLFVASASAVTEYAPPYSSATATITNGISGPVAMTVSYDGKLFVANANATPQSVTEYVAPFANAAPTATITNSIALPTPPANAPALSVNNGDHTDTLAVATTAGVQLYAPPYNAAPTTLGGGINDFVYSPFGSQYGLTATGVAFCLSSCSDVLGAVTGGYALAIPNPTNAATTPAFYVASTDGNVYLFNPNNTAGATTPGGFSMQPQLMPENIASDPHGNLAIVNYEGSSVTIHTGMSTTGPAAPAFSGSVTLTNSILNPSQVQILP